ncbi:outer membrane lipoprotein Omp19 [Bartonella australis AUST/NH1]|uniref:Outer membrane lipoprotein Omp19 n=1 Tax=Bartonella australis (strain Aust/NH1) TaxID=1094489 RepID=M1P0H0_BARAA|nr:AprI/Inh family metalloprotease inhibitor [Bartonella australis]AGF75147.1 outer membrane lipoprotein Omp19 [Bartonella australis AUST/NH1]
MMFSRILFFSAVSSIVILGGCLMTQFEDNSRNNVAGIFYPVQEITEPSITSDLMTSEVSASSVYGEGYPSDGQIIGFEPPSNALHLSPATIAGVWNLSVSGAVCRIATPQTKFGQGYRAGPLHCPGVFSRVSSWSVEGKKLYFHDNLGHVAAALYSTGMDHFEGRTFDHQFVILDR